MAFQYRSLLVAALVCFSPVARAESHRDTIGAPDLLRVLVYSLPDKAVRIDGKYPVHPDGCVSLGDLGKVHVHGLSLEKAATKVARQLWTQRESDEGFHVQIEISTSNSKAFYVIVADEVGERVHRVAWDEKTTVASAVLQIEGLAATACQNGVRVHRPLENGAKILNVDWKEITAAGKLATNHRLEPGDRVYVGIPPHKAPVRDNKVQ